ncbi:YezD family protein [Halobacillus amylolyticus]|uniref:YezD family protein n=1 Tax=Halobacillus amylolyticus TaxID=2932259 RepID=A0ABY4HFB8_9BACI|nr:YezD family protein [Halobacillus amylolyticus]UOR12125.1 YezD family protein [Halobacillus amylolyticus]
MKSTLEKKINDIVSALENIEYGSVAITVHDGEITQIDYTEKKRYPLNKKSNKDND